MKKNNSDDDITNITEEFVEVVKNWVKLDDLIKELNNKIKEVKTEKKEYEEFILNYMENIDENVINITDGKLRKNKTKTKTPLKEENIKSAIYDITQDPSKSEEMTKYIMGNRQHVERVNLKRTRLRKPKSKNVDI